MLGHDLVQTAPSSVSLLALSHADLDILQPEAIEARLRDFRPDVVINASGYTAVDKAETEAAEAFAVNATGVGLFARATARHNAVLVHYSTDYVFDGLASAPYPETAPTNPLNVYGASKLAGEHAIKESGAKALVIRTQWLFGQHGHSFPRVMWGRARQGASTRVVADQFGRPTSTRDLATATWTLVGLGVTGLTHVANAGSASWFDVAERVFARVGASRLVERCSTADYPLPATRPPRSLLDTAAYCAATGRDLPNWRDALDRFLFVLEGESATASKGH
jgi:dTDP-4-dehydrorhamnose reductase